MRKHNQKIVQKKKNLEKTNKMMRNLVNQMRKVVILKKDQKLRMRMMMIVKDQKLKCLLISGEIGVEKKKKVQNGRARSKKRKLLEC